MKKTADVPTALLQLLVRTYNRSIQSYYFFPDVILCGQQRLDRCDFERLLEEGLIIPYHTDSFGKLYRLSHKAEIILHENLQLRRYRHRAKPLPQPTLFALN